MSHPRHPARVWLLAFVALSIALAATLRMGAITSTLLAWLLAANAVAFALWGLDKALARSASARIPESTLHWMAALGAAPATLAGMHTFRHKISKWSFRLLHGLALVAWAALLGWMNRSTVRAWFAG